MKKFLKIAGIVLLGLIVVGLLVLGYFGFVPGLSGLMGSDKPRDLGVTYTAADLTSAQLKLGQELVEPQADPFVQFKRASGHAVETTLTQEEYSAHVAKIHPVSDVQIKLDGNNFEIS
jgi:hypothetical protein